MKKDKILNIDIIAEIAKIGHTQYFVIADAGLPIPKGIKCIDIALVRGVPSFLQTLEAINDELVIESYILAEEIKSANPVISAKIEDLMSSKPKLYVPHSNFKELTKDSTVVIRTGETSSFANIILIAGVNF